MRTYIYFLFALFLLVPAVGCNEDEFLKEEPKDNTFAENLFNDYNGFKMAKYALLNFPRQERREMIQSAELGVIWKIGTDIGWANTELSWTRGLNRYNVDLNPTMQFLNGDVSDSNKQGIFLILYRAISACNMVINRAASPEVDWLGKSDEENEQNKNEIIAHAKLIRAWAYRHLVMTFGPVPLSTEEINGGNYRDDWERNPVEDIQTVIEEDLLFAEQWLPDNAQDVTRLTKAIAQHFLAELYLWQGKPELAEQKANAVFENPNFKLIAQRYGVKSSQPGVPFMDQFYNGNILPSQGNTEALWVFPNSDLDNMLGQYTNCLRRTWVSAYNNLNVAYSPEYGGRGIGRAGITAWALSIYEAKDHRYGDYALRRKYVTRTGTTIMCDSTKASMTTNNNRWMSTRKWDWTFDDPARYGESYSYADQVYLRVADTYLLLAEALHLQGKNSEADGAAYYINLIRTRSNATPITAADVTLDFILDERARELVTEENRRETLVRTGKLIERVRKYNHIASGERDGLPGIQDYHVLLPFPQRVIDANVGHVLEQNDGY
ncbi:MAG: RagB/SusD family nutrient uptake outer membrane protein [Breznakibacter sp.]